jgi:DNA-binding ferritin-like protein
LVEDEVNIPSASSMIARLTIDNQKLITLLKQVQKTAEGAEEPGLANFLQDRIDIHQKHAWMLRATQKA